MSRIPYAEQSAQPQSPFEAVNEIARSGIIDGTTENNFVRGSGNAVSVDPAERENIVSAAESPYGFPVVASVGPGRVIGHPNSLQVVDIRGPQDTSKPLTQEIAAISYLRDQNPDVQYVLVAQNFIGQGGNMGIKALRAGQAVRWGRGTGTAGHRLGLRPEDVGTGVSSQHADINVDENGIVTITDLGSHNGTSVVTGKKHEVRGQAEMHERPRFRPQVGEVATAQAARTEPPRPVPARRISRAGLVRALSNPNGRERRVDALGQTYWVRQGTHRT